MAAKVLILGAGISGLAAAWFLKEKHGNAVDVTILEKSGKVGGWIETEKRDGFLFEKGPRSCRTSGRGRTTLELVEKLGLQKEVIFPSISAQKKYLYEKQKLRPVNFSSLFLPGLKAVCKDLITAPGHNTDQTIYEFFSRRLGDEWTERFIDPMVTGIYAGDIKKLSIKSCFPKFFEWEQKEGSLLKGFFRRPKNELSASPFVQEMEKKAIFSFKDGMELLPLSMAHQLKANIIYHVEVAKIHGDGILLKNGTNMEADVIISTLPFEEVEYASVIVVNLGYRSRLLKQKGFGYLIASREKEPILGCVFDSAVFPRGDITQLTVMLNLKTAVGAGRKAQYLESESLGMGAEHSQKVKAAPISSDYDSKDCAFRPVPAAVFRLNCIAGDDKENAFSIASEAISRHLNIHQPPDTYSISLVNKAIPQFKVGHSLWVEQIKKKQDIYHIGSAINGVSINDCIASAKDLANELFSSRYV